MKNLKICASLLTIAATSTALSFAQAPTPEEAMQRCVAEITKASEAAGQDSSHAPVICECLVPKIGENPDLAAEIETHGGLPSPQEASAELEAAVQSCLPTP